MLVDCSTLNLSFLPSLFTICLLSFFSKTFIEQINTIIRRFWWAGVQEEHQTNPIAFRSWDDICKPPQQGGLGIRDMELINKSLLFQSTWNVATNKDLLLTATLKAKYFPHNNFWTAPSTGFRSVFWASLLQVKHHLHTNATLQMHKWNSSIWSSPWTANWETIHDHPLFPVTNSPLPATVADLWV
jgi:hypothetical protein